MSPRFFNSLASSGRWIPLLVLRSQRRLPSRLACRVTHDEDPRSLDTLSAAYGAAGRMDEARTAARRASSLRKNWVIKGCRK